MFVAISPNHPSVIVGYYTLPTLSIGLGELPETLACKLHRHPVPVALLGRLAVRQAGQGRRIGGMLLADAIKRTLAVGDEIAIHVLPSTQTHNVAMNSTGLPRSAPQATACSCRSNPSRPHTVRANAKGHQTLQHLLPPPYTFVMSDLTKGLRWTKEPLVGEFRCGVALSRQDLRLAYTHVRRTLRARDPGRGRRVR